MDYSSYFFMMSNNNSNNLHLGGLSVQPHFTYIYSSSYLKIFLLFSLAHTAHADLVVEFLYFRSLLIFTPRQQGWLASTISHTFACKTYEIYKILLFTLLFRLARAHGARGLV